MKISFQSLDELSERIQFSSDARAFLVEIKKDFFHDFDPPSGQYYPQEKMQFLAEQAFVKLGENLERKKQPINFFDLREAWALVVVDFHKNNRWGVVSQKQKPPEELTEDQKIFRELVPYFALIIIVAFTVKTAFFYYGMHAASNPSTENKVWLAITLAVFFISMFVFAFIKRK